MENILFITINFILGGFTVFNGNPLDFYRDELPRFMILSRNVLQYLKEGKTIVINMEGIEVHAAQRIIDFTSGATFAISGNLQKISNYIFLVTPTHVDISGDLQDLLNSSFDVPSIKTKY